MGELLLAHAERGLEAGDLGDGGGIGERPGGDGASQLDEGALGGRQVACDAQGVGAVAGGTGEEGGRPGGSVVPERPGDREGDEVDPA